MSFPGLDSITRIGGLVAITCSVLSMVSSFVSIFRYKAEMTRGSGPSAEGFVMLSVSTILLCFVSPTDGSTAPEFHAIAPACLPCVLGRWVRHRGRRVLVPKHDAEPRERGFPRSGQV